MIDDCSNGLKCSCRTSMLFRRLKIFVSVNLVTGEQWFSSELLCLSIEHYHTNLSKHLTSSASSHTWADSDCLLYVKLRAESVRTSWHSLSKIPVAFVANICPWCQLSSAWLASCIIALDVKLGIRSELMHIFSRAIEMKEKETFFKHFTTVWWWPWTAGLVILQLTVVEPLKWPLKLTFITWFCHKWPFWRPVSHLLLLAVDFCDLGAFHMTAVSDPIS